jgi:hypothetical protein
MRRIAAVAVLVLALSACGAHATPGAKVRTEQAPKGSTVSLTSPLGVASVTVGKAVDTVDKDRASDLKSHHAPKGGAFVPVTWTFTYATGFPAAAIGAASKPAALALIAGGKSYPLDTIGRSFGTPQPEYVAVPTTTGLKVGLTYDGLTQTVDVATGKRDAGAAEALYSAQQQTVDCGQGWTTSIPIKAPMDCTLHVTTVPWAGSWAGAGHEYVVVSADIRPYPLEIHRGSHDARYDVRSVTDRSTVDGIGAKQPLQQDPAASYAMTGTSIFDVPTGAHSLDLELDYALQKGGETGPGTYPLDPTVTFSRSVPLS